MVWQPVQGVPRLCQTVAGTQQQPHPADLEDGQIKLQAISAFYFFLLLNPKQQTQLLFSIVCLF